MTSFPNESTLIAIELKSLQPGARIKARDLARAAALDKKLVNRLLSAMQLLGVAHKDKRARWSWVDCEQPDRAKARSPKSKLQETVQQLYDVGDRIGEVVRYEVTRDEEGLFHATVRLALEGRMRLYYAEGMFARKRHAEESAARMALSALA